jgi:hypothetical protein
MADFGILVGSISFILAAVALAIGVYILIKPSASAGPPGPPGPPGSAGATGQSSGGSGGSGTTTCPSGPSCAELTKLKSLLTYMDISNNELVFKSTPTFEAGANINAGTNLKVGEWLIYNPGSTEPLYFRRYFNPPGDVAYLMLTNAGVKNL